ncbi:MAG: hypothetical protein HN341_04905 [Verrucomicrobia bacterium]|nr:hypothetical protein [Verrucomicrobiota bacterium]
MCKRMQAAGFDLISDIVSEETEMRRALLAEQWDVVISDSYLPNFSGTAALALLSELGLSTPFILLASDPSQTLFRQLLHAGAWACHDKMGFQAVLNLLANRFISRACTPQDVE